MVSFLLATALAVYIAKRHSGTTRFFAFPLALLVTLMPIKYTMLAIANGNYWNDYGYIAMNGIGSLGSPSGSLDSVLPMVTVVISLLIAIGVYVGRRPQVQ